MKKTILTLIFGTFVLLCANAQIIQGLRVPRLTTVQRDQIQVSGNPYAEGQHIYNLDTSCEEYWNGDEWVSLCGGNTLGKAELSVLNCEQLPVGSPSQYYTGRDLTAEHYLEIVVNVTKKGTYAFTALPKTPNGYYFGASGEFPAMGTFTVKLQGSGRPLNASVPANDLTKGDTILFFNNDETLCGNNTTIIHINNGAKPSYSMLCREVRVNGMYEVGKPLTSNHYITVTANVTGFEPGAVIVIESNEVDGMKFISQPVTVTAMGRITITLQGQGMPTSGGTKTLILSSNSATNSSVCETTVNIVTVLTGKKFLVYGSHADRYTFADPGTAVRAGSAYDFVTDPRNFGTVSAVSGSRASIVPSEGIQIIKGTNNYLSAANLQGDIDTYQPDAIFIFYVAGWELAQREDVTTILNKYVNEGHPLLWFVDQANINAAIDATALASKARLLNKIFDAPTGSITMKLDSKGSGVYQFSSLEHPALDGPFGDVRGKYWGANADISIVVQNLPVNDAIIFSGAYNWDTGSEIAGGGCTMFMHKTKPFFYCGDSGFINSLNGTTLSAEIPACCHPFKIDGENLPEVKLQHSSSQLPVYNAHFFGNLLTWVMKYIDEVE